MSSVIPKYIMLSEEDFKFVYYTFHYATSEICDLDEKYQDNDCYKQMLEAIKILGAAEMKSLGNPWDKNKNDKDGKS